MYFYVHILYMYVSQSQSDSSKSARSVNGAAVDLTLETLVVTEETIYAKHVSMAQTSNQNLVFLQMKTYYAHYMSSVNKQL